jgi:hypothetical protein
MVFQNGVKEMVVKMVSTRREGGQQRGKRSPREGLSRLDRCHLKLISRFIFRDLCEGGQEVGRPKPVEAKPLMPQS